MYSQAPAFVLGIDVSKDSLDVCLIDCSDGRQLCHKLNNNPSGFRRMKAWLKQHGCEAGTETLCCMEHTGLYTRQLVHYLLARDVKVCIKLTITGSSCKISCLIKPSWLLHNRFLGNDFIEILLEREAFSSGYDFSFERAV